MKEFIILSLASILIIMCLRGDFFPIKNHFECSAVLLLGFHDTFFKGWPFSLLLLIFSDSCSLDSCLLLLSLLLICSVAQSCPALWDPMDYSMPGFPVLHISQGLLSLTSIESAMPSLSLANFLKLLGWYFLILWSLFPLWNFWGLIFWIYSVLFLSYVLSHCYLVLFFGDFLEFIF